MEELYNKQRRPKELAELFGEDGVPEGFDWIVFDYSSSELPKALWMLLRLPVQKPQFTQESTKWSLARVSLLIVMVFQTLFN